MKLVPWFVATLLAEACTGAGQDIDTLTTEEEEGAPDIAGSYDAELTGASGCEEPPPDFITGPLEVSGPPGALRFSFADGAIIDGQIDESFSLSLAGDVETDGSAIAVSGEGLAYIGGDRWVLEVDLSMNVEAEGAQTCVHTGRLEAVQNEVAK